MQADIAGIVQQSEKMGRHAGVNDVVQRLSSCQAKVPVGMVKQRGQFRSGSREIRVDHLVQAAGVS